MAKIKFFLLRMRNIKGNNGTTAAKYSAAQKDRIGLASEHREMRHSTEADS
jgi:hypothetical protein